MTIDTLSFSSDDTARIALEDTVISPRFYTTDFDELDKVDVTPVRAEWDALIAEMKSDPNRYHFKKDENWDKISLDDLPDDLKKEFVDFLVSSLTSEFSGCILYAEMKKRGTNPDICDLDGTFFASSATIGHIPVPEPPPNPLAINTKSAPVTIL